MTQLKNPESKGGKPRSKAVLSFKPPEAVNLPHQRKTTYDFDKKTAGRE